MPELIFMKRVTATPDPWADDLTVLETGVVIYRLGLGGNSRAAASVRLAPARLARLRRLITAARLPRSARYGTTPRRGGFAYTLRAAGGTYPTSSGHVAPHLRPLIRELERLVSRLEDRLRFKLVSGGE